MVGVSLQFLRIVAAGMPRYAQGCLAAPSCRLTAEERAALQSALEFLSSHPDALAMELDGDAGTPPAADAVSRWSGEAQPRLLVTAGRLVRDDGAGQVEPLTLFRGVAELVQRLLEAVPAPPPAAPGLPGKVAAWLHEHAEVARPGAQRSLTAVYLGRRTDKTDLYVADARQVTTLTDAVAGACRCADQSSPVGLKVWSVRWTHGIPGPTFKQPLEGRLNLYCPSGVDHLGDDVLVELFFTGETLTAAPPIVTLMACSLGGCYPHRDAAPPP